MMRTTERELGKIILPERLIYHKRKMVSSVKLLYTSCLQLNALSTKGDDT